MTMASIRVDVLAVRRGLAPTRSAAARLIARGALRWRLAPRDWTIADKAGLALDDACELALIDDAEVRHVSRGGLKLEGALDAVGLDVRGLHALDVGQSTGGFTDVLLKRGAAHVTGVDVGHGQLHASLRDDPRVTALEGVNARHLAAASLPMPPRGRYDLAVADLSFISLALVLPALAPLADRFLLLAKPQFELQPAAIGKGGLVRDAASYAEVEARLRDAAAASGLVVLGWLPSPIDGGDGNREFFLHARRADAPAQTPSPKESPP